MVLGNYGRGTMAKIFNPIAKGLTRIGVTPNGVTYTSSLLVAVASIGLIAQGHLVVGVIVLTILMLADSLDGVLARYQGTTSQYGAFLDSTFDRITDGIAFASLTWWLIFHVEPSPMRMYLIAATLVALVAGSVVPYARSRAENVGVKATLGLAERTDRLVIAGAGALLTGAGLGLWPYAITITWVAFAATFTVGQRVWFTGKTLKAKAA